MSKDIQLIFERYVKIHTKNRVSNRKTRILQESNRGTEISWQDALQVGFQNQDPALVTLATIFNMDGADDFDCIFYEDGGQVYCVILGDQSHGDYYRDIHMVMRPSGDRINVELYGVLYDRNDRMDPVEGETQFSIPVMSNILEYNPEDILSGRYHAQGGGGLQEYGQDKSTVVFNELDKIVPFPSS